MTIRVLRRSFLVGAGLVAGGLALGISPETAIAAADGLRPNLFVHVAPDGKVTIVCHRSEMGQGIRSSLPALIAAELGADVSRIAVVQAEGDPKYGDQNTDGSHSIRGVYDEMRRLGGAARIMLLAAAAKRWKVPASQCTAQNGVVAHAASKRTLTFGELADDAAKQPVPKKEDVPLRPQAELDAALKNLALLDGPDIVTGRAVFGADVQLPGMLTAVIARPPVVGGKVERHDASRALAVAGVKKVFVLPVPKRPFGFQPLGGIAVIAENTWAAIRGRAALDVTWSGGDNASYDSTSYREELTRSVNAPGKSPRKHGDAAAALASAKKRLEATYHTAHLAHAPMEPPAAVAKVEGGACEIWTATQNPQAARTEVAKALGIDPAKVTVHVTLLGGGFGRKSKPDYVVEAALVAREAGVPVRVQWTREDDVRHDYYHSTSAQRLVAGLDEQGRVIAWHHRTAFPPIQSTFTLATFAGAGELGQGVLDLPLAVPNVLVENCEARGLTRIGWLRSVANIYHAFAVQTFMDELAHLRGKDPRDNLIELLGPARHVTPAELGVDKLGNYGQSLDEHPLDTARHHRVIQRVTELSRWDERKKTNRALGLAVHRSFLTYVAVVVSVRREGERIAVDEVWIVADPGTIVNPDRVRSQFEGAVIFGLSLAMYGQITMKEGAVTQSNFRDYRLMRMTEAPKQVHVEIVSSGGPPGGVGEPGVPPVAPALGNALFALTGTRTRELPLLR
jgi:isoquinoline 1-oxidoreductase beta subunit